MAKGDIETYCEDGRWGNRRIGTIDPFAVAASDSREAMIEQGRKDADLYGVAHLIRHADGTVTVDAPARGPGHSMPASL